MAYDPTKPADNSPISSAELRTQLTGLKTLIDDRPTVADVNSSIIGLSANIVEGFPNLNLTISNPPTQAQVQAILDHLNDLSNNLQH